MGHDLLEDALPYKYWPYRQGKTAWFSTPQSYFSHPWLIQKEEQEMSNKTFVWTTDVYEGKPMTKASGQAPTPKYTQVDITRCDCGFIVQAYTNTGPLYNRAYRGAVTTYPEASKLAGKLMKEMV